MALRHPFPDTILNGLQRKAEPVETVPVARRAKSFNFRNGKDLTELTKQMVGLSRIEVRAAVGSGKSTKLPQELSKALDKPVIHVVPSRLLAVDLYDYLVSKSTGDPFHLSLTPADGIAHNGVTITYAANMTAVILSTQVDSAFVDYPNGVILYLDESHESDGYTYFVKKIGHRLAGVKCVVEASATFDAERMPLAELDGENESEYFLAKEAPSKWDPADVDKPWSITRLIDSSLMFVDEEHVATRLIDLYARGGVTAYRMYARMPVDVYRRVRKELTDPNKGVIVMIADYSFRSGFTFPVSTIVDSAVVKYHTIRDGNQICTTRMAYKLEIYQAQNRGGRTVGSVCKYYHPLLDFNSAICGLEGIETELAATLFRLVGFKPPAEVADIALMAVGNVPSDFVKAANGSIAFPMLSVDEMMPLVDPELSKLRDIEDVVEDFVKNYISDSEPSSPVDYFSSDSVAYANAPVAASDSLALLQQLKLLSGEQSTLVAGRYYMMPGLPNEDVVTQLYGNDWRAAISEIHDKPYLVQGFSREQRMELMALFLAEYNTAVAVTAGIDAMLQSSDSLTSLSTRYPSHVREWSDYVAGKLRENKAIQVSLIGGLEALRMPSTVFTPTYPDLELERRISKSYADRLMRAINGVDKLVDGSGYLKYIEGRVVDVDPPPDSEYDKLSIETQHKTETVQVKALPITVGRRRLWDLTFYVPAGLMWTFDDCVEAVGTYLSMIGLSSSVVRELTFVGPKVNSGRVLKTLIDTGEWKHRRPFNHKFQLTEKGKVRRSIAAAPVARNMM